MRKAKDRLRGEPEEFDVNLVTRAVVPTDRARDV